MNTLELNAVRKEIADEILTEKNEVLLIKIIDFIRTARDTTMQPPCQFSVDKLKTEILKSEDDFRNGRYVTMEYMRAKHQQV
ncbi:MAG: hypothetical protein FWD60_09935 [Candidatus Azobacteroides sp.]|nr:hypothetical protein [Candidatus Azobacteroides sp.]